MIDDIDLILFDWSGTISDDRKVVHQANRKMCEYYGIVWVADFNEWLSHCVGGPQGYFLQRGVKATPEEIWKLYRDCLTSVLAEGLKPSMYEAVPQALASLQSRGKKLAVLSSHPEANVLAEAKEYGIAHYFTVIIGSISDKAMGIRDLCAALTTSPQKAAYIGDMIPDIVAARAADVYPIAVSSGYHTEEMLRTQSPVTIWHNLQAFTSMPT